MKVVFDYQIFNFQTYGGVSRYICELAKQLSSRQGFDIRILAGFHVNEYLASLDSKLVVGHKRFHLSKATAVMNWLNFELSQKLLLSDRPDILHETYYSSRRVAPKHCPTVITVHDMIHEKFAHLYPQKVQEFLQVKLEAIQRVDHIICVSQNTKNDLLELTNISPERITVVHHGYSPLFTAQKKQVSIAPSQPYILYVGARQSYKNFERLLRAYAVSPTLKKDFSLVCFGTTPFSQEELTLIQQLGLDLKRVIYCSGGDETLAVLYKKAAAFVYPSLYEGFGIPLLEAMSTGCPVICSNTSSLPEVAGSAAQFFNPHEIGDIADALVQVLYSSDRIQELSQQGKQRAQQFSWEQCSYQTSLVYQALHRS
jgi:glycosyltransferase involved in cell wall biosynthesis